MKGSDSERMMAEIEAFLRTGEAPPPAPEPRPVDAMPPIAPPDSSEERLDPGGRVSGLARRLSGFGPFRRGLPLGRAPLGGGVLGRGVLGRGVFGRGRAGRPGGPGDGWGGDGWGRAGTDPHPGAPRWTVLRVLLVVGLLAALLIVPSVWPVHPSATRATAGTDRASAAPAGSGYTFLRRNRSGTPVRWDPCQPLYYVTNLSSAPKFAAGDLQAAISDISRATGIMFVDRGSTTSFPGGGSVIDPSGPAGPVVIAWGNPAQSARIDFPSGASGPDALARTEPIAETDQQGGRGVYVTGTVLVSSAAGRLTPGFAPGGLGVLFLHELGHLMGLGNVADAGQVMDTRVLSTPTTKLGPGDRAGLNRLGAGSGCVTAPTSGTFQPS